MGTHRFTRRVHIGLTLATITGCSSGADFLGGGAITSPSGSDRRTDAAVNEGDPSDPTTDGKSKIVASQRIDETFEVEANRGKVDMVWTIDNSGSMADEIAHLQAQVSAFVERLGKRSNLRVAIVTHFCDGPASFIGQHCLNLPSGLSAFKRLHMAVGSYDAFARLPTKRALAAARGSA